MNNLAGVVFCFAVIFCICFFAIGWCSATSNMKAEAVKQGHAEWVPSKYGFAEFEWKKIDKK